MTNVSSDDIKRLEVKVGQVQVSMKEAITMIAGDPMVTDPNDPAHVENSILGRLRAGNRRMDGIESAMQQAVGKLAEAVRNVEEKKFDLNNTVVPILKKHGWKILGLAVIGLYAAHDKGWI